MKPISNRTVGGGFEQELCMLLAEHGFWAHNMAQNQVGQPADVIATKNNIPVLIDCKVCLDGRFPFSRIEGNQEGAMTIWEAKGNTYCYFAMKLGDGKIYMIPFDDLCMLQRVGAKSLTEAGIRKYLTLDEWAASIGN